MKIKYRLLSLLTVALCFTACTDDFEDVNTDPNRLYTPQMQSIFPGTVYKTMNVISELNYNRMWSYSRQTAVPAFNVAWTGTDGIYREFYVDILRDLNALDKKYRDDAEHPNTDAVIRTWRAFVYYQILSLYGPTGLDGAKFDDIDKRSFTYSSEKTVYYELLSDLDKAVELFDTRVGSTDQILKDPVYDGNVEKWRKLANTLRLDMALTITNISDSHAREEAAKSMAHEDWLFQSLDDALMPKYGTVADGDGSYYYRQMMRDQIIQQDKWTLIPSMNEYFAAYLYTYNDPRMQEYFMKSNETHPDATPYLMPDIITRPHDCDVSNCSAEDRALHMQLMIEGNELRDSIRVRYNIPYPPSPDNAGTRLPFGWEAAYDPTDPNGNLRVQDPLGTRDVANSCFIKEKFMAVDCTLPLMRWCDACFMEAEAAARWGLGSKTAKDYYEDGIRASFDEWGISNKVNTYMAQDGVAWGTDHEGYPDTRKLMTASIHGSNGLDGEIEQIMKQRWFADFLDGMSCWRNERRTRALNLPPFFLTGQTYLDGADPYYSYPERLYFPDGERTSNREAYYAAIDTLQTNSPKPCDARWGDNAFTTLQFAKTIPNEDSYISELRNRHFIEFNFDMVKDHKYGSTYEDILNYCKRVTGITDDDDAALTQAIAFEVQAVIRTAYIVDKNN